MKSINGKKLAEEIRTYLRREVKQLRLRPKLVVFSINPDPEGASFIKMKQKAAIELGGEFELIQYKKTPRFEDFARNLGKYAQNPTTTGIVIQKPLPAALSTSTLFNYVPTEKEIEGHKNKSPFYAPIGLAILTVLKYIFLPSDKRNVKHILVNKDDLRLLFKQLTRRKKVVVVGRGDTGGKPIGEALTQAKINFINVNSKTPRPESFYREADIIISAVGRKVIFPHMLKKGVILLNIGIRRENDQWKGDYDEEEIKDIASFYTPTPGGVGPLDIAYLMYNLVEATKMQQG